MNLQLVYRYTKKQKKHALSVAPRLLIVKVPVKLIILNSFAHENLLLDAV